MYSFSLVALSPSHMQARSCVLAARLLLSLPCLTRTSIPTLLGAPRGKPVPRGKALPVDKPPAAIESERHLYFDRVDFEVRGGHGGDGALIHPRGGGAKLKTGAGGGIELPDGGGRGGDVILYVDSSVPDLMHLHGRKKVIAERGGNSAGLEPKTKVKLQRMEPRVDGKNPADGRDLLVPVPPGTFVRTLNGKPLGDLVKAGEKLRVALGADGGPCLLSEERPRKGGAKRKLIEDDSLVEIESSDAELLPITKGEKSRAVSLQLLLRTVADVGFVGFPNAGKSTLLGALTRATAEVAPYPFTTLMPQLGAMTPANAMRAATEAEEDSAASEAEPERPPVLADLPGLVEGAHKGKGLGRQFLQQLRRVRLVLFVLDSTSEVGT